MYSRKNQHDEYLEDIELTYKEMDKDCFEEDFARRRDIAGVEGQIDYWKSDNSLRSILSEQQELLVAERQGHEKLISSMCGEIEQLRKEAEKEGEEHYGKKR